MRIIEKIVLNIQETTGLALFGIDVIVSARNGQYYIIDTNVFPS